MSSITSVNTALVVYAPGRAPRARPSDPQAGEAPGQDLVPATGAPYDGVEPLDPRLSRARPDIDPATGEPRRLQIDGADRGQAGGNPDNRGARRPALPPVAPSFAAPAAGFQAQAFAAGPGPDAQTALRWGRALDAYRRAERGPDTGPLLTDVTI